VDPYADYAEFYDLDHLGGADVPFYLAYAGDASVAGGSPVLELGCGTGRILIPLAEAGFDVVDVYGDYERNPYDGTGEILAVARRPR